MKGIKIKEQHFLLILTVITSLFFFFQLFIPITDGDTAYYGEIALNMLKTGDWQTLRSSVTEGIVDKPPLTIWPMAISIKIFGKTDWALKAWHLLTAIGVVITTFFISRKFFSVRLSFIAGLILTTTILFSYMGGVPQQDIPMLLILNVILLFLVKFLQESKFTYYYVIWFALGLGALTRGLAGVVFPAFLIFVYLLVLWIKEKKFPLPLSSRFILHSFFGLVLFLAVSMPWFVAEYIKHARSFLDVFLFGNTRFMQTNHTEPSLFYFFSYFPMLILGFLPWSAFIYYTTRLTYRNIKTKKHDLQFSGNLFFTIWFLVAFFFPFLIKWRVIRYLIPAFPALAVLTARFLDPFFEKNKPDKFFLKGLKTSGYHFLILIVPLLILTLLFFSGKFNAEVEAYMPIILPFILTVIVGGILFSIMALKGKGKKAVITMLITSMLSFLMLVWQVNINFNQILPWKAAAHEASTNSVQPVIIFNHTYNPFLEYYLDKEITVITKPEEFIDIWENNESAVSIISQTDIERIENIKDINLSKKKINNQIYVIRK